MGREVAPGGWQMVVIFAQKVNWRDLKEETHQRLQEAGQKLEIILSGLPGIAIKHIGHGGGNPRLPWVWIKEQFPARLHLTMEQIIAELQAGRMFRKSLRGKAFQRSNCTKLRHKFTMRRIPDGSNKACFHSKVSMRMHGAFSSTTSGCKRTGHKLLYGADGLINPLTPTNWWMRPPWRSYDQRSDPIYSVHQFIEVSHCLSCIFLHISTLQ